MNETVLLSQLDRLAAGDLDEPSRTALIEYLEAKPEYWRDCGLAFLEAQLWSETLAQTHPTRSASDLAGPTAAAPVLNRSPQVPNPQTRRRWMSLTTAAMILLAFIAGRFLERTAFPSAQVELAGSGDELLKSTTAGQTSPANSTTASDLPSESTAAIRPTEATSDQRQVPTRKHSLAISTGNTAAPQIRISNYEKQLLARRGLAVALQRQYLNTHLPDGTPVAVPVDQIIFKRHAGEFN